MRRREVIAGLTATTFPVPARAQQGTKLTIGVLTSHSAASVEPYRGTGEQAVQRAFANTTLIRPPVMFGPGDAFVTMLVKMVRLLPVLPMFGSGKTTLQPVYVEDVAEGVTRALLSTPGLRHACYEFGGPQIYT